MKSPTPVITTLFAVLVIAACEPPATFNEAQPATVSNEESFPRRYRGTFVNDTYYSTLTIDATSMIQHDEVAFSMPVQTLDSFYTVSGNVVVDMNTKEQGTVTYSGDSATVHLQITDTLFMLDEHHVLKRFKGYLFISSKRTPVSWEVRKMALSKGKLTIAQISPEDIEQLTAITESEADSVLPRLFAPTKKQFKQFIANNGFRQVETYTKVRR